MCSCTNYNSKESFNFNNGSRYQLRLTEKTDHNYLVLYRAPHIEELRINEVSNEKQGKKKDYYHYAYKGKDEYNPTQQYPWKDYKVSDDIPSKENMQSRGLLSPVPTEKELSIEIIFSEKMNPNTAVKLSSSSTPTDNDKLIPGKITDMEGGKKSKWTGKLKLNDKEHKKLIEFNNINIHVQAEDTIDHDSMKGLDKDGDGRWISEEDGAFDNNHWFTVFGSPQMSIEKVQMGPLHYSGDQDDCLFEHYEYYHYDKSGKLSLLNDHQARSAPFARLNPGTLVSGAQHGVVTPNFREAEFNCNRPDPVIKPPELCWWNSFLSRNAFDWIEPVYYLNIEYAKGGEFVAELKSDVPLTDYVKDGSIRDYIKLYLRARNPHKPGSFPEEEEITGICGSTDSAVCSFELDPDDDKKLTMRIKPLGVLKGKKSVNGYQFLRLETTNGKEEAEEMEIYASKSLMYFKDLAGPVRYSHGYFDYDSGWDPTHYQVMGAPAELASKTYYDMRVG